MYNTCMLVAFLQQLLTFDGFYDENLEFLMIDKIQIVCSMNSASTVGRHALSTRFTAVVRIGVVDYPETKELVSVYDNLLELAFNSPNAPNILAKYSKDMEVNERANVRTSEARNSKCSSLRSSSLPSSGGALHRRALTPYH